MRDMNTDEYKTWKEAKVHEQWERELDGTMEDMVVLDPETGWYHDIYGWFDTIEEEREYKRMLDEKYGFPDQYPPDQKIPEQDFQEQDFQEQDFQDQNFQDQNFLDQHFQDQSEESETSEAEWDKALEQEQE